MEMKEASKSDTYATLRLLFIHALLLLWNLNNFGNGADLVPACDRQPITSSESLEIWIKLTVRNPVPSSIHHFIKLNDIRDSYHMRFMLLNATIYYVRLLCSRGGHCATFLSYAKGAAAKAADQK